MLVTPLPPKCVDFADKVGKKNMCTDLAKAMTASCQSRNQKFNDERWPTIQTR